MQKGKRKNLKEKHKLKKYSKTKKSLYQKMKEMTICIKQMSTKCTKKWY